MKTLTKCCIQRLLLALGGSALFVLAPAQGGSTLWTNRLAAAHNGFDFPYAMAVDANGYGSIYVTGQSVGRGGDLDFATVAYSSSGSPLWTNRYNGSGKSNDVATAIAVDFNGNVLVTGRSAGPRGDDDYATVAYLRNGEPLWTNRYDGPGKGHDAATAIAIDSIQNVIVTGWSVGQGGDSDYATIAYTSAGVPLWTNRYNGTGRSNDWATAVAVDLGRNVFVTGCSLGRGGVYEYATLAYSAAGKPLWTNRFRGPVNGFNAAYAIAVDNVGQVYVTGESYGRGGNTEYATIAYSGGGVPLWTNRYRGPVTGFNSGYALAVDSAGNLFVTGQSIGRGGNYDYATIGYTGAGTPLWTNRFDGAGRTNDAAIAVAIDASRNVFVTGQSVNRSGNTDYATVGYTSDGVPMWTNRFDGGGKTNDTATAIAVDTSGHILVAGQSVDRSGNYGYATVAYTTSGVLVRANFYGSDGAAPGTGFAPDIAAGVYLRMDSLGKNLVLSWPDTGFILQAAPAVTGPFKNVPEAVSPYTNRVEAGQCYFRLVPR